MRPTLLALGACVLLAGPVAAQPDGHAMFVDNCSACHQQTGRGIPGAFPALDGDGFVTGEPSAAARTVLFGRGGMPSFKNDLSDAQIAAILTYVRSAWSNKAAPVPETTVAAARAGSVQAVHGLQAH